MNNPFDTYQDDAELKVLLDVVRDLKPKSVLEIGSMFGGTLWHWMQLAAPEAEIVSIDLLVPTHDSRYSIQKECHDKTWFEWAKQFNVHLTVFEKPSNQILVDELSKFGSFDFIFIDGDHTEPAVRYDYELSKQVIAPTNSIIAFHDIAFNLGSEHYGVAPVWNEVKQQYNSNYTEIIATHGQNGIGYIKL